MSDPHGKHWLADDPSFLASLNDLDRGLVDGEVSEGGDGEELPPNVTPPRRVRPAPLAPPEAPRPAAAPARPAGTRALPRAINPPRVPDAASRARPLNAPPPAPPPPSAPRRPVPSAAPLRRVPLDTFGDAAGDDAPPPPLAFARVSAERRVRRPLLDLFPPSALEAAPPPVPALGTAVGPRLPPPRPRPAPKPEGDAPSPLGALAYETFYGLREKPFSLSTDPKFHYQSASHERAGQALLAAIRTHSGPAVLTGPLGIGKTTLCRSLMLGIDRRTVCSLVLEPIQSIDGLLKTMLVDFGAMSRADLDGASQFTREALTRTLHSFLESLVPIEASAVVLIDEAQNVPVALLADLGAMLDADGPAARVLQLVLAGQPALTAVLKHADLRQFNASVARRTELGPLAADEIAAYVMHRLSIAGAHSRIEFDEAAIARLYDLSAGVPRVVNLLCDHAMTRGQQSSAGVIDGALIETAAADLDLDAPAGDGPGVLGSLLIVAAFALLVLAGSAGALWLSRDAVSRTLLQWQNVPVAPGGPVRRLPLPIAPVPPPADVQ